MEEMLEFNDRLMENSENTELLEMYKQAYETALKNGANDIAEFYKEKLENFDKNLEAADGNDIRDMYKQAYETALKDGANDMAEFYKHKLNPESEISFGSRSVDMSSDDAKRYHKLEQEYEKASKTYKSSVKNDNMELTYSKNNEKIMEKARNEMEKIENKYR